MSTWEQGPQTIIGPTSLESFMDTHWDDAPLIVQERGSSLYDGLLSMDELDQLIHSSGLRYPTFRLVREGKEIPTSEYTVGPLEWGTGTASGFIDLDRTRDLMRRGCTLVMEACQRLHRPIAELSRLFEQTFQCPSPVNLYVTPPRAQGFNPHFDVQNVFVLQLHGTKRWQVYGPHIEKPLPSQAVHGAVTPGPLLHDITLSPGDLLYLPRGFVHCAHTTGELSAHLSVSLKPTTWADVFQGLVNTLPHDARFRSAVQLQSAGPAEASEDMETTFASLMDAFSEGSDLEDVLDDMGRRFVATRLPSTKGQLLALQHDNSVTLNTKLMVQPGVMSRIDADTDKAHLHFHGKVVSVPWNTIGALRWIASAEPFETRDIPGDISDDTRCQLAQHLVNEGFLLCV